MKEVIQEVLSVEKSTADQVSRAKEEAARIQGEAEKESKRIVDEARTAAAEKAKALLDEARKEADGLKEQELEETRRDAGLQKAAVLEKREGLAAEILDIIIGDKQSSHEERR